MSLLPDDALGAPWEFQWRKLDSIGYGAGSNQTDCDAYWAYETLLGGDGGHAMWWADGGNANHRVIRNDSFGSAMSELGSMVTIALQCPVVRWNEGGSFTTELFDDVDVDALIMRFIDETSGEVTWIAVTAVGDLISLLQIPLWTRADGTMIDITIDDVASIAAQMKQRLDGAGPDRRPPPTTTNPKVPTIVVPPPILEIPTTTVVLDSLGELLLMEGEVRDGWESIGIERSNPGSSDDSFVEACPAAQSLNDIDDVLVWEASFRTLAQRDALQLIGDSDDPATAAAWVRRFAEVAQCDLSALLPGAVGSGGAVEIAGADAASTLLIDSPDLAGDRLELGAAAIGSIVVVFTIDAEYDGSVPGEQMLDFIARGVAKVAAAGG